MTTLYLENGRLFTPQGLQPNPGLVIRDGRIAAIGAPCPEGAERLDARDLLVAPGFIDTHIHGGKQADTMDGTPEALREIARHLAEHGVTSWLPTTVACAPEALDRILTAVEQVRQEGTDGAEVLGAHLESNFLASKYKGAQPPEYLRPIGDPELGAVLAKHAGTIRLMTLAPELEGAEDFVRDLVARGVVVSVGHTDATYDQVMNAVDAGSTRVTHLCNAQRGFHHREPGVLGAGLVSDRLYTEIIADLEHVHPAGLTIAYRCKGPERLMLVSDAVRGSGLEPGRYELGGHPTVIDGKVARLENGTIAGSVITLERAVRNMVQAAGVPLESALRMASDAPARSLGLSNKGRIEAGLDADLVLLTDALDVRVTVVSGRIVYRT
ncbi:MAG TPA: N-acetylglucosamine-6-phosphate deacetylase [Stenomitos sp.]